MTRDELIYYYFKKGKKQADIARMFANPKSGKSLSRQRIGQIVQKYEIKK